MRGAVIEPAALGWDAATQAFNLAFTQEPMLVTLPEDEVDVVEIVRYAAANRLQVAPQRTGHNAEPLGAMENVILLKTDKLRGVEIDAAHRIARVRAGSKWEEVVPRASNLGLAALHGSTPDVSVAGYSLGGGVGWYARRLGLSTNSVTAIEPYTGEGMMLGQLDGAAIDAFVWAAGPGSGSPLVSAEIRHLGGALARSGDGHGALPAFDASYLTFALGMVFDDETYAANRQQLEIVRKALTPYDTGRQYLNFTEEETDPATFYRAGAYNRLRAVKAAVDPDNVFRARTIRSRERRS